MRASRIYRLVPLIVVALAAAAGLAGAVRPAAAAYGPPDLAVSLTASPNPVAPSGTIITTLVVSNRSEERCRPYQGEDRCNSYGSSVSGIVVEVVRPAGATTKSARTNHGFNCTDHVSNILCTGGSLGADEEAVLTIWFRMPSTGGTSTMTATVDPANTIAEWNETNNGAAVSVTVDPSLPPYVTDLAVTGLSASPNPASSTSTVTFTVTVSNLSGLTAVGVNVSLRNAQYPPPLTFVSGGNAAGWTCVNNQPRFHVLCGKGSSYEDGSIPAGGSLTLTITATTTVPGSVPLEAYVSADGLSGPADNNLTNNTRTMTLTVSGIPNAPANLRDEVTYIGEVERHTLRWSDLSTNEERFELTYQDSATTTPTTLTLGANVIQYSLGTAFKVGRSYTFSVRACNQYGCSAPSNTIVVLL